VSAAAAVPLELLRAYDRPGPRYTSYPTALEFNSAFDERAYRERLAAAALAPDQPLSLYLHLPFCEQRCTFCGCMVIITKNRSVAGKYLGYLHRELAMLADALGGRRRVVQYHWGGGTPTYLAPEQMEELHGVVAQHFDIDPQGEAAIEVDPRVTTAEHVSTLRRLGFNRLSLGVQDFDPPVQQAVNRVQSAEETWTLLAQARAAGFRSTNVDLIYGLPRQTRDGFARTLDSVLHNRPERTAIYSYAHVPWLKGHQRTLSPAALPSAEEKMALFLMARERFLDAGYTAIGMDHFAVPEDELANAARAGILHRNFMGYTTRPAPAMVGCGVSAIGDVAGAFAQNVKKLSEYYEALDHGRFPIERGFRLDADDELRRYVIAELMCNFRVEARALESRFGVVFRDYFAAELEDLRGALSEDGIVAVAADAGEVAVSERGRLLVRNVCMVFDRYRRGASARTGFSRTV
jgi:oxygen-independent coproporphyrinogen-3 oxidase